jgi:hypothetical protein
MRKLQYSSESIDGRVAQLGEHLLCKQGVGGSNPLTSTNTAPPYMVFGYYFKNNI